VLFGLPHWWGSPGGLAGVVLAGFMGAFLAIAVVQTGGLGWAVVIHYAQDVVIITVLVARGALSSARLAE
jgi:membrane protease YdiL (CAAX protease family)